MAPGRSIGGGAVVVAALLVAGVAVLALRPGASVVVVDDSPPVQSPADGTGVIAGLQAPGGLALFGRQIIDPTHTVEVRLVTGPGCSTLLTPGDPWPTPHPECLSGVDVVGVVGGLGITAAGQSIVAVTVTVQRDCYDRLQRGMAWPPGIPECASIGWQDAGGST